MYSKELEFAKELAVKAGEMIRTNFTFDSQIEWKSDDSPLTKTDVAINKMVIDEISQEFPSHAVLGEEESTENIKGAEFVWVCDPIDGTFPFSHGLHLSTFSLALCRDGVPVVAVVEDAFHNIQYFAEIGMGAFRDNLDNKLSVNSDSKFIDEVFV